MTTTTRLRALALVAGTLCVLAAGAAGAATITIVNNDGVNEGFNDPTPRAPVGGNPGTTLGAQRLFVFQHAANLWASRLPSNVVIEVRAQFNPLTCSASSAVLGSAGPTTVHANFSNAPILNHWYHQSLANRLADSDLSGANPDINATFNLNIDSGCFGPGLVWYYGIDGNEGSNIELLPVVLHELGHGLGFSTVTSGTTGTYLNTLPSVFDHYMLDNSVGLHWDEMSPAQRVASAIAIDHLVWDGPEAVLEASTFLTGRPQMVINSPGGIAGTYPAQSATFGAALTEAGITGDVVLADDGSGTDTHDACEPLINAGALAGKVALIHRGTCTFVAKAQAAQAAGAIALLVSNNATGLPPMGGTDPSIVIPCIGITQAAGAAIEANLGSGVNVTINIHPTLLAGADDSGRPLMYTPNPFQSGSSVSHWDVTLSPNALMEPAINTDLHDTIDITYGHFVDIGWLEGPPSDSDLAPPVATMRLAQNVPNPFNPTTRIAFDLASEDEVELVVVDVAGRAVVTLLQGRLPAGPHAVIWNGMDADGNRLPSGVYRYELRGASWSESRSMVLLK